MASPRSQNVSYDTVLRMTCTAALGLSTDTPHATIMTWYDGTGMVMGSDSPGVTITTTMFTNSTDMIVYLISTVVVSDIGLQHFGQLTCTANNTLGWDSATWNISSTEEYFPPQGISLEGNNQVVSCGTTPVTLTCSVWGYPPPDVIWTLNGTNIDTSNQMDTLGFNYTTSQLIINSFSLPNAGVYVCTASNDVGNAKTDPGMCIICYVISVECDKFVVIGSLLHFSYSLKISIFEGCTSVEKISVLLVFCT